jgi:hypothetical protein
MLVKSVIRNKKHTMSPNDALASLGLNCRNSLPSLRSHFPGVLGNLVFVVSTIAAYEQLLAGGVVLLWDVLLE